MHWFDVYFTPACPLSRSFALYCILYLGVGHPSSQVSRVAVLAILNILCCPDYSDARPMLLESCLRPLFRHIVTNIHDLVLILRIVYHLSVFDQGLLSTLTIGAWTLGRCAAHASSLGPSSWICVIQDIYQHPGLDTKHLIQAPEALIGFVILPTLAMMYRFRMGITHASSVANLSVGRSDERRSP